MPDLNEIVPHFELECAAAKVHPRAALRAGGVDPSLWPRWKTNPEMPTVKNLLKAQRGLDKLKQQAAGQQAA